MAPRTRVLIGSASAVLAWMLGYGMGGGLHIGGNGGESSRGEPAVRGAVAANRTTDSARTNGMAGTIEEQLAARRTTWTKERLRNSISAIGREPDIIHAARVALKLTEQFGPEDFPLALTVIADAKDELGDEGEIYGMLALARWADVDPKALGEYLQSHDKLGGKFIGPSEMDLALGSWAAKDPLGAIAWVKSLKEKDQQQRGITAILTAVARRDVDEAITMARTYAPEFLKSDALADAIAKGTNHREMEKTVRRLAELGSDANISNAVRRWVNMDPSAAMQWAEELPDDKVRTEALKATWPQYASAKPEEAAEKLSKAAVDSPFFEGAAEAVVQKLSKTDPQAAERWAAALPQPQVRGEAYAALGEFYGNKSPDKGAQWLDGLAPSDDRDKAIAAFISKTKDKDPAAATDWAAAIRDKKKRIDAVRNTLSEWFAKSPGAAMEWLQITPSISEEDRQAILKKR